VVLPATFIGVAALTLLGEIIPCKVDSLVKAQCVASRASIMQGGGHCLRGQRATLANAVIVVAEAQRMLCAVTFYGVLVDFWSER